MLLVNIIHALVGDSILRPVLERTFPDLVHQMLFNIPQRS
jgi:hypothetical protein